MTIKEKLILCCVERGLFPDQAEEAFAILKDDPVQEPMKHRWDDDISEYPPELLAMVWIAMKRAVIAWCDGHLPNAWWGPLFVEHFEATEEGWR